MLMTFYVAGSISDEKQPDMELCPFTGMLRKSFGPGLFCLGIPSTHRVICININLIDIYRAPSKYHVLGI